jgi:hypothetical protein
MLVRRAIQLFLALAVVCALAATVIGPIRALVLFVGVVAVVAAVAAVGLGAYVLFLIFFWPDTNGENWFTRKRR